jgi:hypothetical protein
MANARRAPAYALSIMLVLVAACPAMAAAAEPSDPSVRLYDTGAAAAAALTGQDLAAKTGWKLVPEGDVTHSFKGAAVVMNDRAAVVLRPGGPGGELYSNTAKGWRERALLWWAPCTHDCTLPINLASVRVKENTPGAAAVQSLSKEAPEFPLTYRLTAGQPLVELRLGPIDEGCLWLRCRASYVVVPDFFSDDMAFRMVSPGVHHTRLPAAGYLLNLLADKDAMMTYSWRPRNYWTVAITSQEAGSVFTGIVVTDENARFWVAFLEGQGLWQERKVPESAAGKPFDWQPPFPAKWRANLIRGDGFAESLTFAAPAEAGEKPPALKGGEYIIYPIDRSRTTPLTEFTPVDIMRNTLGVGPCQYILEAEGLASADNPTPDQVMTWVEKQFRKKGGKDAADEIRERLQAMTALVGRTEARIKRYAEFAAEMKKALAADGTEAGAKLKATVEELAKAAAAGLAATQPPDRISKLAAEVVGLIGKDTAAADLAPKAALLRSIGAAQDRALAKSRMAVRWLQCQPQSDAAKKVMGRADALLEGK